MTVLIHIPNFVCVLTNIRQKTYFILLPGSCPRGGTWGAGGSKTLAWGFAMAPHRLHVLVLIVLVACRLGLCFVA